MILSKSTVHSTVNLLQFYAPGIEWTQNNRMEETGRYGNNTVCNIFSTQKFGYTSNAMMVCLTTIYRSSNLHANIKHLKICPSYKKASEKIRFDSIYLR